MVRYSLECEEGPCGAHGVVVHALVTAHACKDLPSPGSAGDTRDVSLACDEGPVGLMELL